MVEGVKEKKKYGQLLNTTGQEINLFWGVDVCAEKKTNDLFIFIKGD